MKTLILSVIILVNFGIAQTDNFNKKLGLNNLESGLVAYYPFNGNANDESGNGNDGTVTNAVLTKDRFNKDDRAYYFNGSNAQIEIPGSSTLDISGDITISVWINPEEIQTSGNRMILAKSNFSNRTNYAFRIEPNGVIQWYYSYDFCRTTNNSLISSNWCNIVFTYNSSDGEKKIFVNGSLVQSQLSYDGHFGIVTNPLTIGAAYYFGSSWAEYFKGSIDDIRIYNRVLDANEIIQLFSEESYGLVAFYPFNGNANDESGNGNDGTVYGATLTTDRFSAANSAYHFDGTNNYIDIGDWENGGAMSFTFWARWEDFNNYSRIVDLGNGSSSNNIIVANYSTNNGLFFSTYTNGETALITPNTITQNQWDFYAATFDSNGVMTVYKNGNQINQKLNGVTPNIILRTKQYIGKSNFSQDGYYKGDIDEVKIYNRTLSAAEILEDYNLSKNNLVAYYPFNGNANDESGNGNDGTVTNAVLTKDRFNKDDRAYYFNGSNAQIEIPGSSTLNISNDISISVWVKPEEIQTSGNRMILGKSNYSNATNYIFRITPNGYIQWEYAPSLFSDSDPLIVNNWHHIVLTSDSTKGLKQIYINGDLIKSEVLTSSGSFGVITNPLTIGAAYYFGSSWAEYFKGSIDDIRIYSCVLSKAEIDTLYSGSVSSILENKGLTPQNFNLFQNYPNPFNPSTVINYQIPFESNVTLKVYDVLGNEIITLVNQQQPAGSYKLNFNGLTLPTGIYFYKIQAGSFSETKKMILLK